MAYKALLWTVSYKWQILFDATLLVQKNTMRTGYAKRSIK